MRKILKIISFFFVPVFGYTQFVTKYPEVPRIDVHTHVGSDSVGLQNLLMLREAMLATTQVDLAMILNLNDEQAIDTIVSRTHGRVLTSISDYAPNRGLTHKPKDIPLALEKGHFGYKIWHGPYKRVLKEGEDGIKYFDDLAHEPVFRAMETSGFPGASIHIADPNGPHWDRGKWAPDPVEYWRQIVSVERVLRRHPNLTLVIAHCSWLICQDAQIDYLRYLLSTYPNLHVDVAATFQYFYLVNYDNLRAFLMEYSDRILYGTDVSTVHKSEDIPDYIDRYSRTFRILETDGIVEGGFFGMNPVKGMALPKEVLEKIYYKNAVRLYPGLRQKMIELGYLKQETEKK